MGYVYLIEMGNGVKIGCTTNPDYMFKSVIASSPYKDRHKLVSDYTKHLSIEHEDYQENKNKLEKLLADYRKGPSHLYNIDIDYGIMLLNQILNGKKTKLSEFKPNPRLPLYSNRPMSETGYELAREAIMLMVDMGLAKSCKGYSSSAGHLRRKLEDLCSSNYGKSNHYISKGDVYTALENLGYTTKNDDGCKHEITSAKIKLPKWLSRYRRTDKQDQLWKDFVNVFRNTKMDDIINRTENYV